MTYNEIIENLRDHLELLSYAGITEIPVLPGSRTPKAPAGWALIEDPEPPFFVAAPAGPDKQILAFGIWHGGTNLCFISGETLTGGTKEPFSGSTRTQMELLVNWIAGELRLPAFDSMSKYLCCGSGPKEQLKVDGAYAEFGARLKKELGKNRLSIIALFGREACGALLGSTDVDRLRGRFHKSGDLIIMPTWGIDDMVKNPTLKRQTMADMKMVIAEAGKGDDRAL